MKIFSQTYVSIATKPFTGNDLIDLLSYSRQHNKKCGITGMLLYKDGHFMQVLEGEEKKVRELSDRIARDSRHHNVITLFEGPAEHRDFSDWSMGFEHLDTPEGSSVPGYSEFMNTPLTADAFKGDPSRAKRLLRIFKRT